MQSSYVPILSIIYDVALFFHYTSISIYVQAPSQHALSYFKQKDFNFYNYFVNFIHFSLLSCVI